jgi:hypothetical protein
MKTLNFTLIALTLGTALVAEAAPVIDQNAPTHPNYMAQFGQTDLAQSFQQSASDIDGAGIFLQPGQGSSGTITIGLYDKLPTAGGHQLASGSAVGTAGNWVDVFWADLAISANTTYFLVFTSTDNSMGIAGDTGNPYNRGQVYANPGYGSFPTFDYTFRTYAQGGAQVPEPASLALVGGALIGLGALARKRRLSK